MPARCGVAFLADVQKSVFFPAGNSGTKARHFGRAPKVAPRSVDKEGEIPPDVTTVCRRRMAA